MIQRRDPDQTLETDRVWTVGTASEVAEVPGGAGDVVHVTDDDTWFFWRPDGTWMPLGGGGVTGPHTHPMSEVVGLDAALAGKAASVHTHALELYTLLTPNALTFTNAPAGGLEVVTTGGSRVQLDLRNAVNVVGQAIFSVIPHANGAARFEFSVNGGGAWATLVDLGTGGYTVNGLKTSASTAVPAAAKIANCMLRVVVTGDGVADPILQKAALSFQGA